MKLIALLLCLICLSARAEKADKRNYVIFTDFYVNGSGTFAGSQMPGERSVVASPTILPCDRCLDPWPTLTGIIFTVTRYDIDGGPKWQTGRMDLDGVRLMNTIDEKGKKHGSISWASRPNHLSMGTAVMSGTVEYSEKSEKGVRRCPFEKTVCTKKGCTTHEIQGWQEYQASYEIGTTSVDFEDVVRGKYEKVAHMDFEMEFQVYGTVSACVDFKPK